MTGRDPLLQHDRATRDVELSDGLRRRTEGCDGGEQDLTDDAVAVLDALGWSRAHLFGLSNGGLVAQRVALRHPERTLSVTSMAATPSDAQRRPATPPS